MQSHEHATQSFRQCRPAEVMLAGLANEWRFVVVGVGIGGHGAACPSMRG